MKYLILGSGRCGGHLLRDIILSTKNNATYLHTFDVGYDKTIVLNRRNIFNAVMSNIIVNNSNQTTSYPNDVVPFIASVNVFKINLSQHFQFYKNLELLLDPNNTLHWYFEDFVNNYDYVYSSLGLSVPKLIDVQIKAPYNYKDKVLNWKEMLIVYNNFLPTEIAKYT